MIGICFQPFEHIKPIERIEHFLDTKAQRHKGTKLFLKEMLIIGKCLQPFEHIDPFERIEPLKHHKHHKPLKHFLFFDITSPS